MGLDSGCLITPGLSMVILFGVMYKLVNIMERAKHRFLLCQILLSCLVMNKICLCQTCKSPDQILGHTYSGLSTWSLHMPYGHLNFPQGFV